MKAPYPHSPGLALLPFPLSVAATGMAAALGALYSWPALLICLATLPVGMLILWQTRDVPAPIDRIEAADRERTQQLEPAAATTPAALKRAA
jgi:hypothetical protein